MTDPVPCPGCGRTYPPERFAADAMLGGLARWLRALGHDTTREAEIADDGLVRHAAACAATPHSSPRTTRASSPTSPPTSAPARRSSTRIYREGSHTARMREDVGMAVGLAPG